MKVIITQAQQLAQHWCGQPSAVTMGNFDGVHLGHLAMLQRLANQARPRGLPTVLLTFEPHPRAFFARASGKTYPVRMMGLRDKVDFLRQTGLVDVLLVLRFDSGFTQLSPMDFINQVLVQALRAQLVLVGQDFCFGKNRQGTVEDLSQNPHFVTDKMPVVACQNHQERIASSRIRAALMVGDLALSQQLLGRAYSLSGKVHYGQQLGRTIGVPTANVHLPMKKSPLQGIFFVRVQTPLGQFNGVASLGKNPTVSQELTDKLEVHLFDFNADLYGKRLTVTFLHKWRDEQKFADWPTLEAQIHRDLAAAQAYFLTHV
jgi:riboflavin kinase/FMN adenylyltransferase